ncbi:MAG TPA: 2-C-methyl-D-erythritol 4-phosphate cytidylyltransferase, partial [Burkholderiales bacterium]|nr:2-C-methyl-D-erythritol 4-phosphate cytidylyltransferase [Burkholderiales bacterium]
MSLFALIPAAGTGSRLSKRQPKQYAVLAGKPMLWHAIRAVCMPPVETVFVVLAPGDKAFARHDWKAFKGKLEPLYCGGE